MKTLVVYYSKSGNTRRVAEEIAQGAWRGDGRDSSRSASSARAFWVSCSRGATAMRGRTSKIEAPKKRPADYDLVFVGSPVWGWNLVPAVRSYLGTVDLKGKPVAFFCTMGSNGEKKTFESMRELVPNSGVLGELAVLQAETQVARGPCEARRDVGAGDGGKGRSEVAPSEHLADSPGEAPYSAVRPPKNVIRSFGLGAKQSIPRFAPAVAARDSPLRRSGRRRR